MRLFALLFVLVFVCAINANELALEPQFNEQKLEESEKTTPPQISGRLLTPEEGCGYTKVTHTKIVGGTVSKNGAFPWIALVAYNVGAGNFVFKCGGSLITSKHVLTAAHCVTDTIDFIRLGEHNLQTTMDGPHKDVRVIKREKHTGYNPTDHKNDIGILTLGREVEFSDRIRPICLPISGDIQKKSFVKSNPFVAGWGGTSENGPTSNVLRQVQVPVYENRICKESYRQKGELFRLDQFSDEVICAGSLSGNKDSCHGDSGGPLMIPHFENGSFPFYQIGIVSYGYGCAQGVPGVYTNIQFFVDWIKARVPH